MIKKYTLLFFIFLGALNFGFGQIITFDFNGLSGNETTGYSNYNDINLGISTITRGPGLTAANNANRFNATSWATNNINNAVSGDDYMEFTITPNPGHQFSINSIYIQLQRSNTGPSAVALRSSVDGYTSNLDIVYNIVDNTDTQNFTFTFSQLNSTSAVTYRFYMYAEGSGGSGGIGDGMGNDIIVNGSVTSDSSCSISASGLTNISCNTGTNNDGTDDFVSFDLDPSGSLIGSNYSVSVDSGSISPSSAAYGSTTSFALQNGSAGAGDVTLTITDNTDGSCTYIDTISDPGNCSPSGISYCIEEDFEGSTTDPSGWTNFSGYYQNTASNAYTGTYYAGMNASTDWISTSMVTDPNTLSFWARTSSTSSNFTVNVQYSEDGISWYDASIIIANGSNTGDVTTNYQLFSINLNLSNDYYIRWYMSNRSSGSFYFDDVELTCGGTTPAPELQLVDDTSTNQNCGYTIDFGSQALSTNVNTTFAIENVGSDDLDITSLGITGNYTVSPTGPMTISAGNSQTFTVTFTPTTNGTQNGTITINNNDPNEGTCTINLTGEGFTPAPEIDIERNTGGTIPNGSSPNIGYNTIFAATVIGDSSSPKTFHVSNEGTSDLDLTSITSSNPTEFSISLNPSPSTISSNTEVDFEIVFSPSGVGLRTSTITIISNDSDENPYTFQVQGNGDCAASPITISPMSGPEATIISITGNNFGSATTATLNGVSISSVNVISSTELELSVPSGATTGSLEITNDLGCLSSELFIVIDNQISSCEGNSGISPTELFISEVTDHGTGHHSYVEIFNGTGATVDLSGYEIRIHNNGASTATSSVTLSGSIINGDVFVLAFGQSDATDAHALHGFDQSSNVNGINEDDHIRLYNGTTWIDLWGDTSGDSFTIASKNYTYRRKNTGIIAPSTTWNSNDWDSFSPVDYTDIGTFDFSTGVPPSITSGPTINQSCNTATISISAEEGFTNGNPLTYQWYYLAPGDSGWTEITDNATFNNSDTAILEILDIFPMVNYQFYCQVREDDQTCFTASNAVILELESVTWNGSSWSPIDPNSNTIAILNADYNTTSSGSFEACNLIINDSALIIGDVNNGGSNTYVEVQYSVYVNGSGSILVHPQAAFVQVNDDGVFEADNPDNCEVDKLTAPMAHWYEYTYWSSPTIETIGDALAEANPNRRFKFSGQDFRDSYEENANTNTFNPNPGIDDIDDDPNYISDGTGVDWQLMNASDDMLPGVGYASTHSTIGFNSFPCGGGPGCQFLYQFKGLFNNGVISVPVYRNDEEPDDNNWNFIGNPYPSAISADAFLEYNSDISSASNRVIEGAIYLWSQNTDANGNASGNQALNFSQSDYAIINGIGSTATSAGGDGSNPDNRMIPSGQGFFITMSDGALGTTFTSNPSSDAGDIQSKDVIFNNSMRVKGNSDNSQFFRNATQETNSMESITLSLTSDNGIFSQVVVGYKDGATDGLDYMYYDAPANSVTNNMTLVYFQIEDSNKKFAIQGKHPESLTLEEVIPLGFQTNIEEASIFNFEIAQLKGDFMLSHSIYIKDNFFNTYHDLTQSAYTFNSETGAFNDRFEIVFQTNVLSTSEQILDTNDLTIVELQNGMVSFTVGKNKTIDKVQIYDLLGRSLLTFKGNSSKEVLDLSSLSSSAYLAKVTLDSGQEITKKAIKR